MTHHFLVSHPQYELVSSHAQPTEYRALRDAARNDARMYAIMKCFFRQVSVSVNSRIRVEDIKEESMSIGPHEKHEKRDVPMNKSAKEALHRYLAIRPKIDDDHVLVTKSGKPFLVA